MNVYSAARVRRAFGRGCLFWGLRETQHPSFQCNVFLAGEHTIGVDVQAESTAMVVAEGDDGARSLGDSWEGI
jgi:hypothetical protein